MENLWQSYRASLAMDHTVLPATRQVNAPRHNFSQPGLLDLPTPEGWKAE